MAIQRTGANSYGQSGTSCATETQTAVLPQGDSCLVVIFGATGDLTRRKLIPALYDLACVGCTSRDFEVLGIGRTKLEDADFGARMHEGAATSKDARHFTEEGWNDLPSDCITWSVTRVSRTFTRN